MEVVRVALALTLAATFGWSGAIKVARPDRWTADLRRYRLPRPPKALALFVVPWVELGIAASIVAGERRAGALLALPLLAALSVAIVRLQRILGTRDVPCGCFGSQRTRDHRRLLARNALLAAAAAMLLAFPSARERAAGLVEAGAATVVAALAASLVLMSVSAAAYLRYVYRPEGDQARVASAR